CEFAVDKMDAFGFTISEGKVTPSRERVEALSRAKKPESEKELLSFLGATNYYRGWIAKYADQEAIMRECVKDGWNWTNDTERAYQTLLNELRRLPSGYPCHLDAKRLELHTNASGM